MKKLKKSFAILMACLMVVFFFSFDSNADELTFEGEGCKIDIIQCALLYETLQLCHEFGDTVGCTDCGAKTKCKRVTPY